MLNVERFKSSTETNAGFFPIEPALSSRFRLSFSVLRQGADVKDVETVDTSFEREEPRLFLVHFLLKGMLQISPSEVEEGASVVPLFSEDIAQMILATREKLGITKDVFGLDPETKSMCLKNNLLLHIKQIRKIIHETYRKVRFLKIKLVKDPEIFDYEKICFEIHLEGEPIQILEDEKTFYPIFYEKVPKEKQRFFTFTYRVMQETTHAFGLA